MRIVAGAWRGRRLRAPAGRATRPTSERVREAAFAIVGDVTGARVLDVFAGSGALGLEALSRGAETATFVERDPRAAAALRANLRDLGAGPRARVVGRDWRPALAAEARAGRAYELVLVDPPYAEIAAVAPALGRALAPLLAPVATLVLEHAARTRPELEGMEIVSSVERTYGDSAIAVLRLRGAP